MAAKEQNLGTVGNAGVATPPVYGVTIKVDDDTIAADASTQLSVTVKNLDAGGGTYGPITVTPIITAVPPNAAGENPTCAPASINIQQLEAGEDETVKFTLDNAGQPDANFQIEIQQSAVPGLPAPGNFTYARAMTLTF